MTLCALQSDHDNNMDDGRLMKISTIKPRQSSQIPAPRSGHRCVADDKNLYLFGGYSPYNKDELFRELWQFNIPQRTWKLVPTTGSFPVEVCSSCVLLDHGCIIIYGGSGIPFGQSNSSKLHLLVLSENRWIEVNSVAKEDEDELLNVNFFVPSLPIAGYGQCMVVSPDRELYVFAGTSGMDFNSYLTRFSFSSKHWEYIPRDNPPFVLPRYRHEAVTYGDRFYVIGGGMGGVDPTDFCNLNEVPSFCYSTKKWEVNQCVPCSKHGFPPRRRCHGCVLFQDKVYICGGYDGKDMYDDIWTLDLVSFQWTKLPMVLPYPVYFHSTAVTPSGCMLTFGGVKSLDADSDVRSNDLHCVWLTLPSLVDLSFQAVMTSIPNVANISKAQLANIGVPSHLLS